MMNDEELDAALRAMSRFDDAQVDAFDLGSSESDLMEDVMSTSQLEPALANETDTVATGSLDEGPGPHKPTRNEIGKSIGCSWAVDAKGDQPR
jgi:hypothetical protein